MPVGGDDAKGDQRVGLGGDNVKRGLDRGLEFLHRRDDVVGGDDRGDGVLVALVQNRRGEADGIGGVAAGGLAEQVFLRQFRQVVQHRLPVGGAGADENAVGRQK